MYPILCCDVLWPLATYNVSCPAKSKSRAKKEALEIMKTGHAASRSFLFFGADRGAVVDVAVLVGTSSHPLNNMLLSNESKHNYHLRLLVPFGMLGPKWRNFHITTFQ